MAKIPSITLSFTEGTDETLAHILCNDHAELPVSVSVKSGGAVIEEVGLCKAGKYAESLETDKLKVELADRFVVQQVTAVSDREHSSHPQNKSVAVVHVGEYDDTRTFLLRTCNKGGLKGDKIRMDTVLLGAYAKLSGYVVNSSLPPQDVVVYSYMNAENAGKMSMISRRRLALKLEHKPDLCLLVQKLPLSHWRLHGSSFDHGAIYILRASYGPASGTMKPEIKSVTNKVYEKEQRTGEYIEQKPSTEPFPMSPDDNAEGITTFYCDSPAGHSDVVLRGVLHGTKERGLISQKLNEESAQYRFEKGTGVASFSWYYMRSNDMPLDKVKQLSSNKIENGMFTVTVEDIYGSIISGSVTCETSYKGSLPVVLDFNQKVVQ